MFSLLILTKDEAFNLPNCLASVARCDDIVILDSFSRDATCEVAREAGARVFQRQFENFAAQRNHALEKIPFLHDWVFHPDADERFNDNLREECERVIAMDKQSAYYVPNRIIFLGKWIRYSSQYPHPQVRLVKIGEVRFEQAGHGQRECDPKRGIGHISRPYDHFNFSNGLTSWVEKHNRYSTDEAFAQKGLLAEPLCLTDLLSAHRTKRRRCLKKLGARLPGRYISKFVYLYCFCRGSLDGYPGFVYCLLQSFYEFLIVAKQVEARHTAAACHLHGAKGHYVDRPTPTLKKNILR